MNETMIKEHISRCARTAIENMDTLYEEIAWIDDRMWNILIEASYDGRYEENVSITHASAMDMDDVVVMADTDDLLELQREHKIDTLETIKDWEDFQNIHANGRI